MSGTPLVMVMPYRSLLPKAAAEGFAVHAVWDPQVAERIFHAGAPAYLDDVRRQAAGFALADFTDPAGFESALRESLDRSGATALYHVGAEDSMLPSYRLAERWGVQVTPARSIELLNDKLQMRRMLAAAGLSPVRFAEADGPDGLAGALAGFDLPVVVKPVTLSGSRAVYLLRSRDDLGAYARLLDRYGYRGPLLVEEYLDGPEYSVETVSVRGRHQVAGVTEKVLGPAPLFVETGHRHPAPPGRRIDRIAELAVQLLDLAGYRTGPAHTEVRWTADGPRIVESQARLGGDRIPYLVELATGIDLERALLQALRGQPLTRPAGPARVAGIRYLELAVGRVTAIEDPERAKDLPGIREVSFPWRAGDLIPATVDWRTRHGHVIAEADSADELTDRLAAAQALLAGAVRVESSPEPVAATAAGRTGRPG